MHRPTSTRATAAVTGLIAALALAACGSDEPDQSDSPADAGDSAVAEPEDDVADTETTSEDMTSDDMEETTGDMAAGTATAVGEAEVEVAETELGEILVDGEGMTLYVFTQDTPGVSTCFDDCLVAWPPLVGEPTAGEGVDEAMLGTITRDDGTVQATYADWPLYFWFEDTEPGDVAGQGVNDVWYVVSPDGEMVTDPAPTS
jgi:predicted lipoprotein with Yx(FWY)xxD motif